MSPALQRGVRSEIEAKPCRGTAVLQGHTPVVPTEPTVRKRHQVSGHGFNALRAVGAKIISPALQRGENAKREDQSRRDDATEPTVRKRPKMCGRLQPLRKDRPNGSYTFTRSGYDPRRAPQPALLHLFIWRCARSRRILISRSPRNRQQADGRSRRPWSAIGP